MCGEMATTIRKLQNSCALPVSVFCNNGEGGGGGVIEERIQYIKHTVFLILNRSHNWILVNLQSLL